MTQTPGRPLIDSFRFDLPASWQQVDLDRETFRSSLERSLADAGSPSLSLAERRKLELAWSRFAQLSEQNGVVGASVLLQVFDIPSNDDADQTEESAAPSVVLATLTTGVLDAGDGRGDGDGDGAKMSFGTAFLAMLSPGENGDPSSAIIPRETLVEDPEFLDFGGARAVRFKQLRPLADRLAKNSDAAELRAIQDTYLVEFPDEGNRLLAIQFFSPNTSLSEQFFNLFRTIAGTVRFYRKGEPTYD
jgi:hypothetical protein